MTDAKEKEIGRNTKKDVQRKQRMDKHSNDVDLDASRVKKRVF